MKTFDLDERLIKFAVAIIEIGERLPNTFAGNHISCQLIRSGISPALNYGEAQGAESRKEFIHKMKISLKELKETYNCLRIIKYKNWNYEEKIEKALDENNQLISIFITSVKTALRNKYNQLTSNFQLPCSLFSISLTLQP
jgi:four helix bundle protein